MRHIIEDESVIYDPRYNSYSFQCGNYGYSPYIKIVGDLKPDLKTALLEPNKFRVVTSKDSGRSKIVPGFDNSTKCLVFLNCIAGSYEEPLIDDDRTTVDIISVYNCLTEVGTTQLKIVAVMHPMKPLVINYLNTKTGRVRHEFLMYNYVLNVVERKILDETKYTYLTEEVEIQRAYELHESLPEHLTKEYITGLTPEDIDRLEKYAERFLGRYPR